MTVLSFYRFYFEVPSQFVLGVPAAPLERATVFPMAIVPNAWGVWNMLHVKLRSRIARSVGMHGALLPLLLMPGGVALARMVDTFTIQAQFALPMVSIAMTLYYLVWKYFVARFNDELGIA